MQAEEALRKRTDVGRVPLIELLTRADAQSPQAYNTLKDQKANAETALHAAEVQVKEQQGEIKRLSYGAYCFTRLSSSSSALFALC